MPINIITKQKLKKILSLKTGCHVQHTGWTCGTCFFSLHEELTNKDWQTVLLFRGDYKREDLTNVPKPENIQNRLKRIIRLVKSQ